MSLRKTIVSLLVASATAGAVALPTICSAAPPVDVVIRVAPPPLRTEVTPAARRGYAVYGLLLVPTPVTRLVWNSV